MGETAQISILNLDDNYIIPCDNLISRFKVSHTNSFLNQSIHIHLNLLTHQFKVSYLCLINSTRRLFDLPSAEVFVSIGSASPLPSATSLDDSMLK